MGYTFAEKIIARKAGRCVQAGECVIVSVDAVMSTDAAAPYVIRAFEQLNNKKIANPDRTYFVLDHATPCPNEKIAELHKIIRDFSKEYHCQLYDQNYGVCHQILLEKGLVKEGELVLGADSHTCSYGAIGAFSTGVGATDLGVAMAQGQTWVRVPETIRVELTGKRPAGVLAKDLILKIIGDLTCDGATYMAIEFAGEGFESFSSEEAITLCNMVVEMGAKSGVFVPSLTDPGLIPDDDAKYVKTVQYRAEELVPMIACPHTVDNVKPVTELEQTPIDVVYVGSCTNGRTEDIAELANRLYNKKVANGVRLVVCPASAAVLKEITEKGYLSILIDAGASISMPGCSLCVGTLGGVPANGERVLSTTNRNFKGRMGNGSAFVYLCSPATAAAAALTGFITDPRRV